jgi:asparagine synthase (glutamine-hydrolysing)
MCGIAGYVDFTAHSPNEDTLIAMTASLSRRGPDACGILFEGPCGLAHTRLSVIDVEGSPQPMSHPDCDISLVYNGELYNYRQLREALVARGVRFQTNGDTEVVQRSIAEAWSEALPRFDAMFAVAAWDSRKQRLLLARDAFGEKPLFYACPAPGVLVFGSELKAVLQDPRVDPELNEEGLRQALRFRAVYSSEGLRKGIQQLEPGCFLEFGADGLKKGRFHALLDDVRDARARFRGSSDQQLIDHGRQIFLESVSERLIADVPLGVFLSGGLDSSMIVAAMRRLLPPDEPIRTFSVGFHDDPQSELAHAQVVADAFQTLHQPIMVGPEDYIRRLGELSACRDGPVSQPADVAIAEMSRVARQSVKVVLSGEGADEVFAGYPKHAFANSPWLLRRAVSWVGPRNAADLLGLLGQDKRRALVAFRALAGETEVERLVQWFSYFDRDSLEELLPGLSWTDDDTERTAQTHALALAEVADEDPLFRMQATDLATWLPGNMLERGDRMTMAEGLEVRVPFLDKELVAFGMALPERLKVQNGVGKRIVRHWAKDLLPAQILNRPKWGFRVPLANWFRGPLRDMLHGYLSASNGLVGHYGNPGAVARLLAAHDLGQVDASEALWTLLTTEIWYSEVYRKRRDSAATRPTPEADTPRMCGAA